MNKLILNNINKKYTENTTIVDKFNLEIKEGEFIVFVGPSGCGKSTILRMIAGLETVSSGQIFLNDKDITLMPPGDREIAMVFQSYALYPHMSVEKNMGFSLKMSGMTKIEIKKKIDIVAEILQLENLLDRKPMQLSGGQRQRVAIGRAIVRNPKLFLFDEPLSNLDAKLRVEMRLEITKLHKQLKSTMIYVTHDQVEAMTMAERIVVLRDGKIEQVGTPLELYNNPINSFVAGFLGSPKMNFLEVNIDSVDDEKMLINLFSGKKLTLNFFIAPNSHISSEEVFTLGIRPEDIYLVENNPDLEIALDTVEHLGSSTLIYGNYKSQALIVSVKGTFIPNGKGIIGIKIKEEKCHLFTKDGKAFKRKIIS